jgi:hypothetical protein
MPEDQQDLPPVESTPNPHLSESQADWSQLNGAFEHPTESLGICNAFAVANWITIFPDEEYRPPTSIQIEIGNLGS